MKLIYALFIFATLANSVKAQPSAKDDLFFYGDIMINALESSTRERAEKLFYKLFKEQLSGEDSYDEDWSWLRWISVLSPDDNAFKIYTWEWKQDEDNYKYFGFIQFPDNSFVELTGEQSEWRDLAYDERTMDDWISALYYKIMEYESSEGKVYLLFGRNQFNKYDNVKLVETLTIKDKKLVFGHPAFVRDGRSLNRLVLRYADDAMVSVNYNEDLNLLMYDHLIPRIGRLEGQGETYLPDGSYEGYALSEGQWKYVEKIYNHVYDEAPRPKPVLDNTQEGTIVKPKTTKKKRN
jgi:hypothetical protein